MAAERSSSRDFETYLRTGRRSVELKFNPYHDPANGQFTFAPGGGGKRPVLSVDLDTGVQTRRDGSVTAPLDPPTPLPRSYRKSDSNVNIPVEIEPKVEAIAADFARRTGRTLTIVSGRRSTASQATAMFNKFHHGSDGSDYRNRIALDEVRGAYLGGLKTKKPRAAIIAEMKTVLDAQVGRGIIISRQLVGRGIDIRTSGANYTKAQLGAMAAAIKKQGGSWHPEGSPPHIHVQF